MERQGIIDSQGFQLGYRIEGDGIQALVIGSSVYYPRTFLGTLRHHLQLVFVDHRGFVPPPSDDLTNQEITLDVLLNDIEKVRKALNLDRFIIIGHSGHAFLALEYAKRYPQHVSHVVMIGASPDYSAATTQARIDFFEKAAMVDRKMAFQKSIASLPDQIAAEPDRRFVHMCVCTGPLGWYDYRFDASPLWAGVYTNMQLIDHVWGVLFRDIDITEGLDKLEPSVWLALGKYDFLTGTPFLWDQVQVQFKNLVVTIFEKSAHTPQFEEAERSNQELLKFVHNQ